MEGQLVRDKYASQQHISSQPSNVIASKMSHKPVARKFELRIRLFSSDGTSVVGQSGSFVLTKVKKTTTIVEIKQAIEKLKGYKIETQSLHMPQELAQAIHNDKTIPAFEKQKSQGKVETHMADEETLATYSVFDLVPYLSNGQQGMSQLFLDVSNRPILVRINFGTNQVGSRVNASSGSNPRRHKSLESIKSTSGNKNVVRLQASQIQGGNAKQAQEQSPVQARIEVAGAGESGATGGIQTINSMEDEIELRISSGCSVYCLKYLIQKRLMTPVVDQVLSFGGLVLLNNKEMQHYGLDHQDLSTGSQMVPVGLKSYDIQLMVVTQSQLPRPKQANQQEEAKSSQKPSSEAFENTANYRSASYKNPISSIQSQQQNAMSQNTHSAGPINIQNQANLNLQLSNGKAGTDQKAAYNSNNTVQRIRSQTAASLNQYAMQSSPQDFKSQTAKLDKITLGIDFTFNTIKNVKKVTWKEDAPWYREISDGFSWIAYCHNHNCKANEQLVVINRGFGAHTFSLQKDWQSGALSCPVCKDRRNLKVKNCGFVNCEWTMRGILRRNKSSKIYADGRTYDGKLHTFKECDYLSVWTSLDIQIKDIDPKISVQNIPDPGSRAYKLRMMQLAQEHRQQLAAEGSNQGILQTDGDESLTSDQVRKIKHDLIHDDLDIAALAHLERQQAEASLQGVYNHPNVQVQVPKLYIEKQSDSEAQKQGENQITQGSEKGQNNMCFIF